MVCHGDQSGGHSWDNDVGERHSHNVHNGDLCYDGDKYKTVTNGGSGAARGGQEHHAMHHGTARNPNKPEECGITWGVVSLH